MEKWEKALDLMGKVLKTSRQRDDQNTAALFAALCMIELERFEDLFKFLPLLRKTNVQYDIDLNISLIEAADKLAEDERYLEALLLYQSVFSREELIAKAEETLTRLEKLQSQIPRHTQNPTQILQRKRALSRRIDIENGRLKRIQSYPDYEIPLKFRTASCYYELDRPYESFVLFHHVARKQRNHELAPNALYSAVSVMLEEKNLNQVKKIAPTYIETYPEGGHTPGLAKLLVEIPIAEENYLGAVNAVDYALKQKLSPADRAELTFLRGYSLIQLERNQDARDDLQKVLEGSPSVATRIQAEYWQAMSLMFEGRYDVAREAFKIFVEKHPGGGLSEDAQFRIAMATYALGDLQTAEKHFKDFLATHPDSSIRVEALNMLGDLAAAEGRLDQAVALYRSATRSTDDIIHINYSTFQQARLLELEARWDEIITLFTEYREQYGVEGAHTVATYWIVNALKQGGNEDEALEEMYNAISRYGNEPKKYGIDMMIRDLAAEYQSQGNSESRNRVMERLYKELTRARETRQRTLSMRLVALFAELRPEVRIKLAEGLLQESYITEAAPITLNLMGRYAREVGLIDFATKVYRHFLEHHAESDLALPAYRGMAELLIEKGKAEEAEPLLLEISSRFAMFEDAGWATLRLGELRRKQKNYDEAMEFYNMVLAVKEWRGETWAEALYRIGDLKREQNDHREAFAFFQRVYVMYEGYPEWAARAYAGSAECLVKFGRIQEAVDTYREMIAKPNLRKASIQPQARKRVKELEALL
jgi:TolA-binding protein